MVDCSGHRRRKHRPFPRSSAGLALLVALGTLLGTGLLGWHQGLHLRSAQPPVSGTWGWTFKVERPTLETCVNAISSAPRWRTIAEQYSRLPRLGIVVTTGKKAVRTAGLNHMEAYAYRHGYGFHSSIIDPADWQTMNDGSQISHAVPFFTARWHHLQQRHLGNYQWLLMLDGDSFALNMSRSLDKFLASPEDVLLHIRGDYEIGAGAVLLRSTPFSHCFLEDLVHRGTTDSGENFDNGDLIDLIMDVAEPPFGSECKFFRRGTESYRTRYMQCFRDKYSTLLELHRHLPIKVLFPMQGFWRDFYGVPIPPAGRITHLSTFFSNYYRTCAFPGDILGHGWKDFESSWPESHRKDSATNFAAHDSLAACVPRSLEEELRVAQDCCFTHYPGCINSDGANVCHGTHCPKNTHWWHPNCTSVTGLEAPMNL